MELSEDGLETVATWTINSRSDDDRLVSERVYKSPLLNAIEDLSLKNKTLIVITALVMTNRLSLFELKKLIQNILFR